MVPEMTGIIIWLAGISVLVPLNDMVLFFMFMFGVLSHVKSYSSPVISLVFTQGSQAGLLIVMQLVTGLLLVSCSVQAGAYEMLTSIERGFLELDFIQECHALGATLTMAVILLHSIRNLVTVSSFAVTGQLLRTYLVGALIAVLCMLICFSGYAFAFGNMSYWGVQVIFGFLQPFEGAKALLLGDFEVGSIALAKLVLIHFLFPFVVLVLVMVHLFTLHSEGSSMASVSSINSISRVEFSPYLLVKDSGAFLLIILIFVGNGLQLIVVSHPDNKFEADAMVTPSHILPEWYFLPLYSLLKIINQKEVGFIVFVVVLFRILVAFSVSRYAGVIFLGLVGAILPTLFSSAIGLVVLMLIC